MPTSNLTNIKRWETKYKYDINNYVKCIFNKFFSIKMNFQSFKSRKISVLSVIDHQLKLKTRQTTKDMLIYQIRG